MVIMTGNYFGVRPGDPAFNVMTNLCDYFLLGAKDGDDVWLEGQIVDGEFLFNGRLYLHDGSFGTLIESFPKGPAPDGWTQRRKLDVEGYDLIDSRGEVVFSYQVRDKECIVAVNLYKADGSIAAHGGQGGFVSHIPTMLGRRGIVIG